MLDFYLTAKASSDRLTQQAPIHNTQETIEDIHLPSIVVNRAKQFQEVLGFGGAFTESAAYVWHQLEAAQKQQVIDAYFSAENGHHYSLCRVHMNSCDFSLGNYAHLALPDDVALTSFNIDRDKLYLLPFIKAAMAACASNNHILLLVSPWSPPAWMKSNRQMNNGGKLLPQYHAVWAQCFVRFIQAYQEQGVSIWGVSLQNEPLANQTWDSCLFSAHEERDFVRDYLGPALRDGGLAHINIIVWDHNRDRLVERANVIYSDPKAADFVWGSGFHWYGENCFDNVQLHHDAWPDKHLLFTEGCQEGGTHIGAWELGERYAQSMINDMQRWTVGWIDWNLLLNNQGGPNHVGNFCSAPILLDEKGEIALQSSYFYIGHFARFIQVGARRILCASSSQQCQVIGFINPDDSVVVIALNCSEQEVKARMSINGHLSLSENNLTKEQSYVIALPARSMATYIYC